MAGPLSDEVFARTLNQMGIATLDQIEAASRVQKESSTKGQLLSLADVLVQQGIITHAMRENVEKKALVAQQGGIKQLGPYKILKKIGEGGMGAVYLADDTSVGRKVALKVLPKKFASDQTFLARFRREAKATGKLNHVNIVTAYTTGEDMGVHYYAMEFCEGEPLDAKLNREKALTWDKAIEVTMQVARGLKHAHENGLSHRDIKPANILLTTSGVTKILDLGLSKNISDAEQSFATQTGVAMGTPHYISPEQARGDKSIDGRTDIYSLGATLYHLITGQTPFQGSTGAMIMMKHITEQLPNPQDINEDIPEGVVLVIQRMMSKEPDDRYRDCAELLRDLELVIDGKTPSTPNLDAGKSSVAMRQKLHPPRRNATRGSPQLQHKKTMAAAVRVAKPEDATEILAAKKPKKNSALLIGGAAAAAVLILVGVFAFGGKKKEDPQTVAEPTQSAQIISKQPDTPKTESKNSVPPNTVTVSDAWVKEVQALPAEEQAKRVNAEMKRLNDGLPDCKIDINNHRVISFECSADHTHSIAPVRALTDLERFVNHSVGKMTPLKDISPLKGLKLKRVELEGTSVDDLSPLRGMTLEYLGLNRTPVSDLTPLSNTKITDLYLPETKIESIASLEGSSLRILSIARTAVADLSPLKSMKTLLWLDVSGTRVTNLEPLRKSAVATLILGGCKIADASPLGDMANLSSLASDTVSKRDLDLMRAQKVSVSGSAASKDENLFAKAHVGDWIEYSIKMHAPGQNSDGTLRQTVKNVTPKEVVVELVATISGKPEKKEMRVDRSDKTLLSPLLALGVNLPADTTQKEMQTGTDDIKVGGKSFNTKWLLQNMEMTDKGGKVFETLKTWICPDVPVSGLVKSVMTGTVEIAIEVKDFGFGGATPAGLPQETTLDLGGGVRMEMVLVPSGEFLMGDDNGNADEKPAHKVKISQPFYIGKYEVTVAQFRRFVETAKFETECERDGNKGNSLKDGKWQLNVAGINWKIPGFKQEENHPVLLVSWNDAQAFVAWASKITGRDIRLPTEAQWEYSARGIENKKFPWGNKWDGTLSNHGDLTLKNTGFLGACTNDNDGFANTSPVGNYKNASWCGAFDMAGNAWEWVNDKYQNDYYAKSPAIDPPGGDGGFRVFRGGSWLNDDPGYCRAARRLCAASVDRSSDVGFRVAMPAVSAPALAAVTANTLSTPPKLELFDQPGNPVWLPADFKYEKLATVNQPLDMDIGPDGRIWIAQKDGSVLAYSLETKKAALIAKINAETSSERGLHGIVCDPEFLTNGYIYLYYSIAVTPDKKTIVNRLARLTVAENGRGSSFLHNSEKVLLEIPSLYGNHQGGALKYNPLDKKLYVTSGDNNNPKEWQKFFGDPKSPAQDLADLRGKVLRVNLDGSIPADNPFVGKPGARGEIFTYGHRNPYTMNIDAPTGRVFVGEMGGEMANQKEDYEELNLLKAGGNFGWPLREGPADGKYAGKTDPRLIDPWLWYQRENGASIMCGPVYRANAGEYAFPAQFHGGLFYADYVRRWIRFVTIDPASGKPGEAVEFAIRIPDGPLSMLQGPDGALYIVEYSRSISRIMYQGAKVPPPQAPPVHKAELPHETTLDLGGGIKMEMVLVPAGEFIMGDDSGNADEKPAHKVKISQPFYVGKYEVTVAQFRRFAETAKYETECERNGNKGTTVKDGKWQDNVVGINWKTPGFKQDENHPVVLVSWNDSQAFVAWASKLSGRDVRLPTEAQWEYAARGTESKRYPWGDKWDGTLANHGDMTLKNAGFTSMSCTTDNDGFAYTSPVGSFKNASWCGAFDMAGNAWEWVNDKCQPDYYAKSPAIDPPGGDSGARVFRGGCWHNDPYVCRAALRYGQDPGLSNSSIGFRVAMLAMSKTGVAVLPDIPAAKPEAVQSAIAEKVDDPARWVKAVDLLKLIDVGKDRKNGHWNMNEFWVASTGDDSFARLELPYHPPDEYDFRIDFTPQGANPDVNQLLSKAGQNFHFMPAGNSNSLTGFAIVNGAFENASTIRKSPCLKSGQRYSSIVQVRNDGVKAFVDGKLVTELKTDYLNLTLIPSARLTDAAALAVLSHNCRTVFHAIQVIEVTGKGTFVRPTDPAAIEAEKKRAGK